VACAALSQACWKEKFPRRRVHNDSSKANNQVLTFYPSSGSLNKLDINNYPAYFYH
jgi:hypothetical protein